MAQFTFISKVSQECAFLWLTIGQLRLIVFEHVNLSWWGSVIEDKYTEYTLDVQRWLFPISYVMYTRPVTWVITGLGSYIFLWASVKPLHWPILCHHHYYQQEWYCISLKLRFFFSLSNILLKILSVWSSPCWCSDVPYVGCTSGDCKIIQTSPASRSRQRYANVQVSVAQIDFKQWFMNDVWRNMYS